MNTLDITQAQRRIGGLGLTAFCLLVNVATEVMFPRGQRVSDLLMAGTVLGLSLTTRDRRWAALGQTLAVTLALAGAANLRGWPVAGLWACVLGGWFLRGRRARGGVSGPTTLSHRNGSA